MEVFADAQSLAGASDVVVEGSVGEILAREPDDPEPGGPSLTVRILPLTVRRVLAGDLRATAVINVITQDKAGGTEDFSPLEPGQHVVLFLEFLPQGTPGISSVSSFYVPKSGDYGTFDVAGTRATSRAAGFRGLWRDRPLATEPGRLTVSLDDLSTAVQGSKKLGPSTPGEPGSRAESGRPDAQ